MKRIGERCRDYDEKGFCALGSTCPYEHGTNPIIVPGEGDGELTIPDEPQRVLTKTRILPSNSALATDVKKPSFNSNNNSHGVNGSGQRDFGRGNRRAEDVVVVGAEERATCRVVGEEAEPNSLMLGQTTIDPLPLLS